ncbi:hypothetical protein [Sinorhizobium chiapasense]|uniref:Uncharacterized protein n=1 Tax=Sinorhizobium chiapasense TaxID=501572 RepID=A0ABZ2BAY6_9HYPH
MTEKLQQAVAAYLSAIDSEPEKDIWDTWDGKPAKGAEKTSSDAAWADHGQRVEACLTDVRAALATPPSAPPERRDEQEDIEHLRERLFEAEEIIKERNDRLALVDRISDLLGLPQDQELDQVAFELWFSKTIGPERRDAPEPVAWRLVGSSAVTTDKDIIERWRLACPDREIIPLYASPPSDGELVRMREAAIRKAGQVAIDGIIDGWSDRISMPDNNELADYLTRIVDACARAALSAKETDRG